MNEPVKVDVLFRQTRSLLTNLPQLKNIAQPFCKDYTFQDYLRFRMPKSLVILKLMQLIISIVLPLILKTTFNILDKSDELIRMIPVIGLVALLKVYTDTQFNVRMNQMSSNMRYTMRCEIYNRELLHSTSAEANQIWEVMNGDVDGLSNYHNSVLSAGYESCRMLFAIGYLYYHMKETMLVGLIIGVSLAYLNKKVSDRIGKVYEKLQHIRKGKIKLITFFTMRLQELKMCRLQNYIYGKMLKIREEEFQNLTYYKFLDAICVLNWQLTGVLISSITLVLFKLYMDSEAHSKSNIMVLISIFGMLIMPLNMMPWAIAGIKRAIFCRATIRKQLGKVDKVQHKVKRLEPKKGQDCLVKINKGILTPYPQVYLEVDRMRLHRGEVYAVSGQVGVGKSSFLKALAGLVSSQFKCELMGKVGYVEPTSFHLPNALCSIFNTLDVRQAVLDQRLKELMIAFHCLEIPLRNPTQSYSGGQKLRLSLVRASLNKDIVIVNCDLNSLDQGVREYVIVEMKKIARKYGKVYLVRSDFPLSSKTIEISNGTVKFKTISNYRELPEHKTYKDEYCAGHLKPLEQLFESKYNELTFKDPFISLKYIMPYFKSVFHIIFLVFLAANYILRNNYHILVLSQFQNASFVDRVFPLLGMYILAAIGRAIFFAVANLRDSDRMTRIALKDICFESLQRHHVRTKQNTIITYQDELEQMGTSYPFHLNILCNNFADIMIIAYMIIGKMPLIVFLPAIFMSIIFYQIQRYYRSKIHPLNDMSKFCIYRELQVVTNSIKGKQLIKAFQDEQKYIEEHQKWLYRFNNTKACQTLLDQWMTQRLQLLSIGLLLFVLGVVAKNYRIIGEDAKTLSLVITYCLELADKIGHLIKSLAETEKEARCLRTASLYMKPEDELDMDRMSDKQKQLVMARGTQYQKLEKKDLWFKYNDNDDFIIRGLSLTINPGEKVMIRGRTGAGKTTLFKIFTCLFKGFSSPSEGYVSFSPQKPLLLEASLEENLDPYGLFTAEQVEKYAKKFSTRDVTKLSESEKLRVNMYRAQLYGRNGVIIYDEPGTDIAKNGTCLIVSHKGEYKVDKRYELTEGVLKQL